MAALTNLGFETGIPEIPGLAPGWTFEVVSTAEDYAAYDAGYYPIAWEDFSFDWGVDPWSAPLGAGEAAIYTDELLIPAPAFEDFAVGWSNVTWIAALAATEQAQYDGENPEDFEESWDNSSWQTGLGATGTAQYDAENHEDFEESWNIATWGTSLGATSAASYDGAAPEAVEDFAEVEPPIPFSVDVATDVCTAIGHPLNDDDMVRVDSSGTPPGGLSTALDYYVVNATADTFQLARVVAGTPVTFDHQGGGTHYALRDPTRFWNTLLED